MKTIYKYPLVITDVQVVAMPSGAKVLSAMVQNGVLCLWAEIETESIEVAREVLIVGTGHPIRFDWPYVGSVIMSPFVWHVYLDSKEVPL